MGGAGGGAGAVQSTALHVDATDVVKVVLQFLRENGLQKAFAAMEEETGVALNVVDSLEGLVSDVHHGKWDGVLATVKDLRLPRAKLEDLYEQIVLEMAQIGEVDTARSLLRQTNVMSAMRAGSPDRFSRLERLLVTHVSDPASLFPDASKEQRRARLADALAAEVSLVPPSRLMAMIGQALQWQQHQGMVHGGTAYDVFAGQQKVAVPVAPETDAAPVEERGKIKFGKKCAVEAARFTVDGHCLVTASSDGFIEVWDPATAKLKKELGYQAEGELMMHLGPVTALEVSKDGELVVAGDQKGDVKVWRLRSGKCLRTFEAAHGSPVTAVCVSQESGHVLSGAAAGTLRVHGIKSGRRLKDFAGHPQASVNAVQYLAGGAQCLSAAGDGTVKIWDARSMECAVTIAKAGTAPGTVDPVLHAAVFAKNSSQLVVFRASPVVQLVTLGGQVVKEFAVEKEAAVVGGAVSPQGTLLYVLGASGRLHMLDMEGAEAAPPRQVHGSKAMGLAHHPHLNVLATYGRDAVGDKEYNHLKIWA